MTIPYQKAINKITYQSPTRPFGVFVAVSAIAVEDFALVDSPHSGPAGIDLVQ